MLKPLTKEQIDDMLETGIRIFADQGYSGAGISWIAREAGVSVGVIYKYYEDKEGFFTACVDRALEYLDRVFEETEQNRGSLMDQVEGLIQAGQDAARHHPAYFRLYHQITSFGPQEHAREMAEKIEERSAVLYRKMIESAKESSTIKTDLDPAFFAYFFDNLMMMLHFSYACVYYQKRFQIYCGEEILEQEEKARQQLMGFIEAALMYQMKEETNGDHSGI